MIYVKHYYIDPVTEEAFLSPGMGPNGKMHPEIPNLDVKFQFQDDNGADFCISVVDPAVDVSPFDGAEVISYAQMSTFMEEEFNQERERKFIDLFQMVKGIKAEVIDLWWHSSEITSAMTIKIEEAKAAGTAATEADARTVAPFITQEADARSMTVKELAQRIISNYDGLIGAEAVVSGHRGLLSDQMNAIVFDKTSMQTMVDSFAALRDFDITQGFDTIRQQLGL